MRCLRPCSGGCFLRFFSRFENGVHAVSKTLQRPPGNAAAGAAIAFEGAIYAFEDGGEGNAGFLPGLDNGPVERGNQKVGTALLPEIFLNLREVVEIVEGRHGRGSLTSCLSCGCSRLFGPPR